MGHLSYSDGAKRLLRVHGSLLIKNLIFGASCPHQPCLCQGPGPPPHQWQPPLPWEGGYQVQQWASRPMGMGMVRLSVTSSEPWAERRRNKKSKRLWLRETTPL